MAPLVCWRHRILITKGKVYLVGAGPGDPELISVKGARCLSMAEVVVYDRLAQKSLLDLAPPNAEMIDVGKAAGDHTLPQNEINKLLVQKAQAGKVVVRLKGGDPFVLGRGGEEAEELRKNNLPFEIVPGITSAVAVPAYAGIPVTHRGMAASFAVITGHEDPAKATSGINWEKLAGGIDTVIFLMGLGNLAEIVSQLIRYGKPANTPVAVISEGTHPTQSVITGTLENIARLTAEKNPPSPAIIVVGNVVKMREKIAWFDNRPLSGKRILITRASHQASSLSRTLADRGAFPIEMPSIQILPISDSAEIKQEVSHLNSYDWLIFTSANAVTAFWTYLTNAGKDSRELNGLTILAIGPATAQSLAERGIHPDVIPADHTSEGIMEELKAHKINGKRLLMPRADIADKAFVHALGQLGASVTDIAIYRTLPAKDPNNIKETLRSGGIDAITFASSSAVTNFAATFKNEPLKIGGAIIACIGTKTAEAAETIGLKVDIVAKEQTISGLADAIEEYFREGK